MGAEGGGWRFKKAFELLNLRAPEFFNCEQNAHLSIHG